MKTFKQFNESVKDLLIGKSDEEIIRLLNRLSPNEMLITSIQNNYIYGVKKSIELGASIDTEESKPIKIASEKGYVDIVKILLNNNANPFKVHIINSEKYDEIYNLISKYRNKSVNESVRDLLQPKSDDEMIKALEGLSDSDKIIQIIKYQLDYDLLPRNSEGICTFYGHLDCEQNQLTSLPDNLVVNGDLYCYHNQLTSLPENLVVKGNLDCSYNELKSLPENLVVKGDLYCRDNPLPKNIKKPKGVKGELIL